MILISYLVNDEIDKSEDFIKGYRNYYSSYSLWADTKAYRNNLPSWRTPWKKIKKSNNL